MVLGLGYGLGGVGQMVMQFLNLSHARISYAALGQLIDPVIAKAGIAGNFTPSTLVGLKQFDGVCKQSLIHG